MTRFRAIVRIDDGGFAVNVGGAVETRWQTIEFECPALAAVLELRQNTSWYQAQIAGIEVLPNQTDSNGERR